MKHLNFGKSADDLLPVVVQDSATKAVLMLGYMNEEALRATERSGRVTFYSRKRNSLWTKGETSGNFLDVVSIAGDCDDDTILIQARPHGPTCHRGTTTCFQDAETNTTSGSTSRSSESDQAALNTREGSASKFSTSNALSGDYTFLSQLIATIRERLQEHPEGSYIARLAERGLDRIAQKVGEEAVETVIAAKNSDTAEFEGEAADLFFHLLVLLEAKGSSFVEILKRLETRHKK